MALTIVTFDWVPPMPRGYVRDLRARWACEEAGLPYAVETVPMRPKSPAHQAIQPFAQVPILREGALTLFESGAIVLHLAQRSDALMPADAEGRAHVLQWVMAALGSVESWTLPWLIALLFDRDEAATARAATRMDERLGQLAAVLEGRDWLVGDRFTAADLLMADVLRIVDDHGGLDAHPLLRAYVARATARPAFRKAHRDQLDHFAAADAPVAASLQGADA